MTYEQLCVSSLRRGGEHFEPGGQRNAKQGNAKQRQAKQRKGKAKQFKL